MAIPDNLCKKVEEIGKLVNNGRLLESLIEKRIEELRSSAKYWDNIYSLPEKKIKECMKDSDYEYKNAIDRFRGYVYGRWIEAKNAASLLELLLATADMTFADKND